MRQDGEQRAWESWREVCLSPGDCTHDSPGDSKAPHPEGGRYCIFSAKEEQPEESTLLCLPVGRAPGKLHGEPGPTKAEPMGCLLGKSGRTCPGPSWAAGEPTSVWARSLENGCWEILDGGTPQLPGKLGDLPSSKQVPQGEQVTITQGCVDEHHRLGGILKEFQVDLKLLLLSRLLWFFSFSQVFQRL